MSKKRRGIGGGGGGGSSSAGGSQASSRRDKGLAVGFKESQVAEFDDLEEDTFLNAVVKDSVTVVEYPLGGDTISVTKGVVSRIEVTPYAHGTSDLLGIQIDAAINRGNSGGPAFNEQGECIGVDYWYLDRWADRARILKRMRKMGLRKDTGKSWIELEK